MNLTRHDELYAATIRRQQYVLAVLSVVEGASFSPVQIQKLLFLLDQRIPDRVGGPFFSFVPYDYGPYDKSVYTVLKSLADEGKVSIDFAERSDIRRYRATETGLPEGKRFLDGLEPKNRIYMAELANWVRKLSFTDLISTIYREYPEMAVNSVFKR